MKLVKKIIHIPIDIIKTIIKGIEFTSLLLSRGFYFFWKIFYKLLYKIIPVNFFEKVSNHCNKRMEQPEYFLILVLIYLIFIGSYNIFFIVKEPVINLEDDKKNIVNKDEKKKNDNIQNKETNDFDNEVNPFRIYSKYSLDEVNFKSLKEKNNDTVAWLSVDNTVINYPIVKTDNNNFYLNHTFDKTYRVNGWTFMDYRNNVDMNDFNTVFYGHNLLNQTSFGSLSKIFTNEWLNNSSRTIVVLTENGKYTYKIFSAYYIEPEVYYLSTDFASLEEYDTFLNTIKSRNIINISESVSVNDKIITLSTCSNDNTGRKVVHAKLINKIEY